MQRPPLLLCRAFTLIETITVIAIITVLAGLVLSISGPVKIRGAVAKADADVRIMAAACESYKADHGGYPQDNPSSSDASLTNDLDARVAGNPNEGAYERANLFLYKQLTGDQNANNIIDAGETAREYCPGFFQPSRLDSGFRAAGIIRYIADPFGNPYGYSTAGLRAEQDFRTRLQTEPGTARSVARGCNATFDLWSTGGTSSATESDRAKWIKNW